MSSARLLFVEVENFKSYRRTARLDLKPLTVIIGANNSGKSSLIQALLLLKQTLAQPRADVPLHLEGIVEALSLRELTWGWPTNGAFVQGPRIKFGWHCEVTNWPNVLASISVDSQLDLQFADENGQTVLRKSEMEFSLPDGHSPKMWVERASTGGYTYFLDGSPQPDVQAQLEHFFPFLRLGPRIIHSPRNDELDERFNSARVLLFQLSYLGSMRVAPVALYRAATVPPEEIGVGGEYAAQMLQKRRNDAVHYLPPIRLTDDSFNFPSAVRTRPLVDAISDILHGLGVDATVRIEDVQDIGFRLFFGKASLQHVGRGLSYLLPVIQLGLVADPLRFSASVPDGTSLDDYLARCGQFTSCAMEEPEAHLHPKVQSRLAHWFVALAMAGRQLIIETHSDHLVRRLRRLAARAGAGSALEKWLLDNVNIVEVVQDASGESTLTQSRLTSEGGIAERWPAGFMDEAIDEERSIYDASLDKPRPPHTEHAASEEYIHDDGPEPTE